mgnify:CR=1 FL=1
MPAGVTGGKRKRNAAAAYDNAVELLWDEGDSILRVSVWKTEMKPSALKAELGAKAPGDVQYLDDADIADLQLSPEQGSRLKSVAARAAAQP